jgi:hypothetical protein
MRNLFKKSNWVSKVANMTKLTLCLVTKGRQEYLSECLDGLKAALAYPCVEIFIFDNGAPREISNLINQWAVENRPRVKLKRFDNNDSRPSAFWKILKEEGVDWVVFPSDDDIFVPAIIETWQRRIAENSLLVALGTSAHLINSLGESLGQVVTPTADPLSPEFKLLARAFHEPPFHWPSLFMRLSKLPERAPHSRFAFDWWVGVNLILAGNTGVSGEIGIKYRVHDDQESALAPLKRKNLETLLVFSRLLDSQEFATWRERSNFENDYPLWLEMSRSRPIYGDENASYALLLQLLRKIESVALDSQQMTQMLGNFAKISSTLLRTGEVRNLIAPQIESENVPLGNFLLVPNLSSCLKLQGIADSFSAAEGSISFSIYCEHSQEKIGLYVKCEKFSPRSENSILDLIVNDLTFQLENSGYFDLTLTGGERLIIKTYRKLKVKLPNFIMRLLRQSKRKSLA